MRDNMYDEWWNRNIAWRLNQLKDPSRRYAFLVKEADEFRRRNANDDAYQIIRLFDHLIKLETFKIEDEETAWEVSEHEKQKSDESLETAFKTLPPSITESESPNLKNPYPRIFVTANAYLLFEHWHEQVQERTQLAEYSFIYWSMVKDGYIHVNVRPTEFIDFLNKAYEIDLPSLKQLARCNGGNKVQRYATIKRLFLL